jgi:N-acetylglucosamine kinase-like BadF-type ATPase
MREYYLGIDIGGSKSHALICNQQGLAIGFGVNGSGNWEIVGYPGLQKTLHSITTQALSEANLDIDDICGAGFGIAGYDWPSQITDLLPVVKTLELNAPFEIVNDTNIGLLAGASEGWGIALVAGSGSNCRGWNQNNVEGRMVSGSAWAGENGGGTDLVRRALRAIAHHWTQRGPDTLLTHVFLSHTNAKDLADFIEQIELGNYHFEATAAEWVFEAARQRDPVAQNIICETGRVLADMACGVIRQLDLHATQFEIVLVGSLYQGSELLTATIKEIVYQLAPKARFIQLTVPPVIGGVLLGMQQTRGYSYSTRDTLVQSTLDLLQDRIK